MSHSVSHQKHFQSFDELESFLRNWNSFIDPEVYDLVGMAALIGACLDNVQARARPLDFEEFAECLSDEQKATLHQIDDAIRRL